jgi:hypothetical protein
VNSCHRLTLQDSFESSGARRWHPELCVGSRMVNVDFGPPPVRRGGIAAEAALERRAARDRERLETLLPERAGVQGVRYAIDVAGTDMQCFRCLTCWLLGGQQPRASVQAGTRVLAEAIWTGCHRLHFPPESSQMLGMPQGMGRHSHRHRPPLSAMILHPRSQ